MEELGATGGGEQRTQVSKLGYMCSYDIVVFAVKSRGACKGPPPPSCRCLCDADAQILGQPMEVAS
jgi:hypothetical protein